MLRIVAVYGPTGACLPGFTQNLRAVQHETDLVSYLQQQVVLAQAKDWTLVVLGDLNSFTDGALDKWQGQWQVRDECLAVQCRQMGLIDTWRDSHPALPLTDVVNNDQETADSILQRANVKWRQDLHFLDTRGHVTLQRDAWYWDGFHTQLDRWLSSLSAPGAPHLQRSEVRQSAGEGVARNLRWAPSATETADKILLVEDWIQKAQTLRAKTAACNAREGHDRRVHLLRSGDLRRWARCRRMPAYKRQAYTPQQLTTASRPPPLEMRKAAAQEWQKLFDRPSRPWSHELVRVWTDPAGLLRGSPNTHDVHAPVDVLTALLCPGPWTRCVFQGHEVQCLMAEEIRIQIWRFRRVGGLSEGRLLGPCEGPVQYVVHVNGQPLHRWTLQHWLAIPQQDAHCLLLLRPSTQTTPSCLDPLTEHERFRWLSKMSSSRPGPSGWKLCYLMLEEAFKAIEGPVTHRLVSARASLPAGSVYSAWNRAYEPGQSAASDVLYLDVQVCEDSLAHHLPLARVPADFEKFFNTVNLHQVDAVQQARGLPDSIRQFYQAAFQGLTVQVDTRWGPSDPVHCHRGVPQGAVSSPELSKPAQDPLLRLRESSPACYISSAGRRVPMAGYVADAEHYASGARQLPRLLQDLSKGSLLTGICMGQISCLCHGL